MKIKQARERILDWNNVCIIFEKQLGWERGVSIVCYEKNTLYPKTGILDLTKDQYLLLKKKLREAYKLYVKN